MFGAETARFADSFQVGVRLQAMASGIQTDYVGRIVSASEFEGRNVVKLDDEPL